jgi:carbamoyltransferase
MAKTSITILGIHDGHDAGAAIVRNGKILAALQEERPRNVKHFSGTPECAAKEVFKIADVHPSEIDTIAVAGLVKTHAPLKETPFHVKAFWRLSPFIPRRVFAKTSVKVLHRLRKMRHLEQLFSELGTDDKEVIFVEHHLAHAACAYRTSPWSYDEPVLILTADGAGDMLSSTVSIGEKGLIQRIAESLYYDSLGNALYSEVTRYLGLKPWDHEYKVMGLAPYGKPEGCIDQVKKIIRVNPKHPLEFQNTVGAYCGAVQGKLKKLLVDQRFDNIAAATQEWFEELIIGWIQNAIRETDIHKVACAGGLFLNVKTNKLILEMAEVEDAYFYPAAGDDGLPVGAALQSYFDYCIQDGMKPQKEPTSHLYYGPSYSNDEIKSTLKHSRWDEKAEYYEDIDAVVGELVSQGKIVARFNGSLEFGPRALGNRSILADASDLKVIRKINFAIKHRDFWMPFAPTILKERMNEYLMRPRDAPYMILAFDTTEKRDDLIAGIHPFDQTCRPQTLDGKWNHGYRKVLETFQDTRGFGGLLNTSFNIHGYPIVCTPEQAVWTLENSGLDALALGNYLIKSSK